MLLSTEVVREVLRVRPTLLLLAALRSANTRTPPWQLYVGLGLEGLEG